MPPCRSWTRSSSCRQRFDPDAVPALVLLDGPDERDRVEGIQRERLTEIAGEAGIELDLDGLPEFRPGCASRTRDPTWRPAWPPPARRAGAGSARAPSRSARSRTRSSRSSTAASPTACRSCRRRPSVSSRCSSTGRDPQEVVAVLPPYDGEATVEKVAINAVMAGCPGEALPVVLAAVEAACRAEFALHGLLATTIPAGPDGRGQRAVRGADRDELARQRARPGQPRQPHDRPRAPADRPQRRRWQAGRGGPRHARADGQGRPASPSGSRTARGSRCRRARRSPTSETGVTLVAAEAPRVMVDQLAREPEGLCAVAGARARERRPPQAAARLRRDARGGARARPDLPRGGLVAASRCASGCSSSRRARPARSCAAPAARRRVSTRSS